MACKSSCNLLLLAAVLLSVVAAASASGSCVPGVAFRTDLLPHCRDYVLQQTCGTFTPGSKLPEWMTSASIFSPMKPYLAKLYCCQELAEIPQQCRCEALRYFIALPVPSQPVDPRSGNVSESCLIDLPGCPRQMQWDFVRLLVAPGQCNLATIHNVRYCPAVEQLLWI
uniref:Alpha-amylase tetrameric inhibitor subunit CM3 n=1 Tax=Triticum aestivum TaxID=4565 RepID=A0A7H1K1V7_WHEAT|nr:alpha-amylase tetrameric inhibitor subunit CM3 [Triticum aestivum]